MSLLYPWQRIDVGGSWFSDYEVSFVKLVDPHAKVILGKNLVMLVVEF